MCKTPKTPKGQASPDAVLAGNATSYNDTPLTSGTTSVVGYKRRWQIEAITGQTKVRKLTVRIIPTTNDRRTSMPIDLATIIRSP